MLFRKHWIAIIFLILQSACYNKEFNEPGKVEFTPRPTDRVYESDLPRAWAAVQRVLGKFPVSEARSETNGAKAYLVTDWIQGKSDVLYSGFDRNRIPYTIRYKMYVYLQGGRGRTKVVIKSIEQYKDDAVTAGVDMSGSLYSWIRTESSTLKESQLLDDIQKVLSDRNFVPQ